MYSNETIDSDSPAYLKFRTLSGARALLRILAEGGHSKYQTNIGGEESDRVPDVLGSNEVPTSPIPPGF